MSRFSSFSLEGEKDFRLVRSWWIASNAEEKENERERKRGKKQEKGGAGQIVNRRAIVLLSGMGPVLHRVGERAAPWRKTAPLIVPKEWWSYDGPIVRPPSSYLYTRNTCTHVHVHR